MRDEVMRHEGTRREERPRDDTAGRKLGLFAMAGVFSVAAIISLGVLSGGAREQATSGPDPLAQLVLSSADPKSPPAPEQKTRLELSQLSFPAMLVGDENGLQAAHASGAEHPLLRKRARAQDVPAGSLAGDRGERLQRATKVDPLMAQAMFERGGAVVQPGTDGAFMLQVDSYDAREPAERFAATLRARGHRAYVSSAELTGRGRSFRVRVGPFTTRREALAYQVSLEQSDRLASALVVGSAK